MLHDGIEKIPQGLRKDSSVLIQLAWDVDLGFKHCIRAQIFLITL